MHLYTILQRKYLMHLLSLLITALSASVFVLLSQNQICSVSILLSQQMFHVYIRIMLNFYEDDKGLYLTPTYRLTAKYPGRLLTVAHLEKEVRAFISSHLGCSS